MNNNSYEVLQELENTDLTFLNQLTPVERSILNVLINEGQALNVNAIHNNLVEEIWFGVVSVNKKVKEESNIENYTPHLINWVGELETHNINEEKIYDTVMNHMKNRTPRQKRINQCKKVIKDLNIANPPDQKTIAKIVNKLEEIGVVLSRELTGRKGKRAYYINSTPLTHKKKNI